MKKSVVFIFLVFSAIYSNAQLTSKVDERFELTSIAFRLAGAEEYLNNEVKNYVNDIDNYFAKYKNHILIKFIEEIRKRDHIAYAAVSSSATLLKIEKGRVSVVPDTDISAFLENDSRWTKETFKKYVKLLNLFYKDTKFNAFSKKHQELYTETEKRLNRLLSSINAQWFQSFFGKSLENPEIYISLCNGSSNYALTLFSKNIESKYGIVIGCTNTDENGIPVFNFGFDEDGKEYYDSNKQFTIIHELSHNFTNPMLLKFDSQMKESSEKIFAYTQADLIKSAYGNVSSVIYEGLNNLFTNMYFRENGGIDNYSIYYNECEGFIWMRRAVRFMENFYANRSIYVTIENFMPQIVSFINNSADQIDIILKEFNDSHPYVMNVYPPYNSTVTSQTTEIRIDFSHPMHNSYGIEYANDRTLVIPQIKDTYWTEDKKTLVLLTETDKEQTYGFALNKNTFSSTEGFNLKENYQITFRTK